MQHHTYTAALYCRLSADDGQTGESGSIQTQKTLLTQYCSRSGIAVGDIYCDDGWSGTNFERPDFQRMMEDLDAGKMNTVIVKDLSRFGREYAQTGWYIEHDFAERDIRFISVNEGIDTLNGTDDILMPMTNVINSLYAKECSRKTKLAHRARAEAGKYLGGHAPFGYLKDPEDRHHLIVDPEAAEVVRKIFRMFCEGIGYVKMTKLLRQQNVLNPQAYFNQNNPDYYKSDYWRKPFDWHATSIRCILSNRIYLGQTVFGKTESKSIYSKKRFHLPESEWIIVENTHEPIISRETWDTVQQMMKSKRRPTRKGEVQMFAGLVKCADCGSSLNVSYDAKKQKYTGFSCWVYKNYGRERCTSHAIGWKTLNQLVLEDIRRHAGYASLNTKRYMETLTQAKADKQKRELAKHRKELQKAEKRIDELDQILSHLYEDYALERIPESRCQSMSSGYEQEQRKLKEKQEELTKALSRAEESTSNAESFIQLIRQYTEIEELNATILNQLIERIVVHEKTVAEDGSKSQRDIYYKFMGRLPVKMNYFQKITCVF